MPKDREWRIPVVALMGGVAGGLIYAYVNYGVGRLDGLDATKVIIYMMTVFGSIVGLLALGLLQVQNTEAAEARQKRKAQNSRPAGAEPTPGG